MTTKNYRLADGSNIGKNVLVSRYAELSLDYAPAKLIEILTTGFKVKFEGNDDSDFFTYAFVEVTPEDFSDEELTSELNKRFEAAGGKAYHCSTGDTKNVLFKEKTLADFSAQEIIDETNRRGGFYKLARDAISILEKVNYNKGYEAGKRDGLNSLGYSEKYAHDKGYEAGKRAAEPKWIDVKIDLPKNNNTVLVYCSERKNAVTANYHNKQWLCNGFVLNLTHWQPLPKPPEQEKSEIKGNCGECDKKLGFKTYCNGSNLTVEFCSTECLSKNMHENHFKHSVNYKEPKYTCAQCGKEIHTHEIWRAYGNARFCSPQCLEDYEWVDAESPRDDNKICRAQTSYAWIEGVFIGINLGDKNFPYIVKRKDSGLINTFGFCQVRRDSEE